MEYNYSAEMLQISKEGTRFRVATIASILEFAKVVAELKEKSSTHEKAFSEIANDFWMLSPTQCSKFLGIYRRC